MIRSCGALRFVLPVAIALNGCTAGSTGAPAISQVNPDNPNYSKLQFAVGTANIYGVQSSGGTLGLNVVSTLRQPDGASAVGVDTPIITPPAPLPFAGTPIAPAAGLADPYTTVYTANNPTFVYSEEPSLQETSGATLLDITGTPQTVHPGTPVCDTVSPTPPAGFTTCPTGITPPVEPDTTTFGQSGGVFAMGLAPYNVVDTTQQSYSYAPYAQPFYEQDSSRLFEPWGGPPAFDPNGDGMGWRDGLAPAGIDSFGDPYFLGIGEGITTFESVTPLPGAYQLAVQIGTVGNNGTTHVATISASATLASVLQMLPDITTPTVTPDANGDGGASVVVVLPAGVTEAFVQIVDFGPGSGPGVSSDLPANCQGPKGTSFAPVYYTIEVTASGTYQLPATSGPNINATGGNKLLTPTPSICTAAQNTAALGTATSADDFTVQIIGFDYPDYEAVQSLMLKTVPQAPTITGPNGQSDITISAPLEYVASGTGYNAPTPLGKARRVPERLLRR
ncbi:MAG TPA: hypothetical protein VME66_11700 [Candidatus Acidoferrales bacterium]|nr:hypothetical protein [Candidatus Acidoferrales bacterium]